VVATIFKAFILCKLLKRKEMNKSTSSFVKEVKHLRDIEIKEIILLG